MNDYISIYLDNISLSPSCSCLEFLVRILNWRWWTWNCSHLPFNFHLKQVSEKGNLFHAFLNLIILCRLWWSRLRLSLMLKCYQIGQIGDLLHVFLWLSIKFILRFHELLGLHYQHLSKISNLLHHFLSIWIRELWSFFRSTCWWCGSWLFSFDWAHFERWPSLQASSWLFILF